LNKEGDSMRKCIVCDCMIPLATNECPNCGWKYEFVQNAGSKKSLGDNDGQQIKLQDNQQQNTRVKLFPGVIGNQYHQPKNYQQSLFTVLIICMVVFISLSVVLKTGGYLDDNRKTKQDYNYNNDNGYVFRQEDIDRLTDYYNKSLNVLDSMKLEYTEYYYGSDSIEIGELARIYIDTGNYDEYLFLSFIASESYGPYITATSSIYVEKTMKLSSNNFSIRWMQEFLNNLDSSFTLDLEQIVIEEINQNFSFRDDDEYSSSWDEGEDSFYLYSYQYTKETYVYVSIDFDLKVR